MKNLLPEIFKLSFGVILLLSSVESHADTCKRAQTECTHVMKELQQNKWKDCLPPKGKAHSFAECDTHLNNEIANAVVCSLFGSDDNQPDVKKCFDLWKSTASSNELCNQSYDACLGKNKSGINRK